jgi:hypothetical protein
VSPIAFLLKCRAKNWLKSLRKQPGQLVFFIIIFVFAFMPILFDSDNYNGMVEAVQQTERLLGLGIALSSFWLVELVVVVATLQAGMVQGVNMFSKADVEYLFCSHIAPQRVLLYGLLSYLKVIPIYLFVIIYQIPNLLRIGLTGGQIVLLVGVLILVSILAGVVAMLIYNLVNIKPKLKVVFTVCIYAISLLIVAAVAVTIIPLIKIGAAFSGPIVQALLSLRWIDWIPLTGWAIGLTHGILMGMTTAHWIQLALLLATGGAIVFYLSRTQMDFYESATVAAETAALREKKMGIKKGTIFQQQTKAWDTGKASRFLKKDKIKSGIGKGWGPMTIFYRQQVEEKRRRPLGVGLNTVILFLIAVALHIFFPNLNSDIKMVNYLLIFTYDMLFFLATSTFQDELEMDQFYYLPGRSVQKVLAAMLSGFLARCKDALPGAIVLGVISGVAPLKILVVVLVLISVILSIQAQAVLATAIFGGLSTGLLYNFLRMLISLLLLMPSIAAGVIVILTPETFYLAFGILIVFNLLLSCLIFPSAFSLLKKGKG